MHLNYILNSMLNVDRIKIGSFHGSYFSNSTRTRTDLAESGESAGVKTLKHL